MEIAVCDDNKEFLAGFESQVKTLPGVENVFAYSDLSQFLLSVDGGKRYDAVLMDIEWGKGNTGMDAAEELYKLSPETKIIYVTGNVNPYSQEIFLHRANLSGFLAKPVDIELLRANLQKVADALPFGEEPALVLKQKGVLLPVPLREIYYIQSKNHTVSVHMAGETITAYEKLENLLHSLSGGFFQCHKSYIVNMSQIRRFEANDILLKNGETIPASRARYAQTRAAYLKFMGQKI